MGIIDRKAEEATAAPSLTDIQEQAEAKAAESALDFEKALKLTPKTEAKPYAGEGAIDRAANLAAGAQVGPPKPFATAVAPVGSPQTGAENPELYKDTERAAETISAVSQKQEPTATPPVGSPDTGIENPDLYNRFSLPPGTAQPQEAPAAAPPAPAPVPAPAPASPPAPEAAPFAATEGGEPSFGGQTYGAKPEASKKETSFGEKLKKLAQKIGVPLLHLIQAGAYGYAGINKPTVLEELKKQQAERKKTEEGRAFEEKIRQADRAFSERMAEVQRRYERDAATARSVEEQKQAEYNAQQAMERLRFQADADYKRAQLVEQSGGRGKTPTWDELLK